MCLHGVGTINTLGAEYIDASQKLIFALHPVTFPVLHDAGCTCLSASSAENAISDQFSTEKLGKKTFLHIHWSKPGIIFLVNLLILVR